MFHYLIEKRSLKRVWIPLTVLTSPATDPVTELEWKATQSALKKSEIPPLYYEILFEGIEHRKSRDVKRSVIDFAVSSEVYLRSKIIESLPKEISAPALEYLDEANIRRVLTKLFPVLLSSTGLTQFKKIEGNLHQLFDARNEALHSGTLTRITDTDLGNFESSAKKLIALEDTSGNWKP